MFLTASLSFSECLGKHPSIAVVGLFARYDAEEGFLCVVRCFISNSLLSVGRCLGRFYAAICWSWICKVIHKNLAEPLSFLFSCDPSDYMAKIISWLTFRLALSFTGDLWIITFQWWKQWKSSGQISKEVSFWILVWIGRRTYLGKSTTWIFHQHPTLVPIINSNKPIFCIDQLEFGLVTWT